MNSSTPLTRATLVFINVFLLYWALTAFKSIFIPFTYAFFLSLLMLPLCRRLEGLGLPKALSIFFCLGTLILGILLVVWFFSVQVSELSGELGMVKQSLFRIFFQSRQYLRENFNLDLSISTGYLAQHLTKISEYGTALLTQTISITTNAVTVITLVPIYFFCMLFYRHHFEQFIFSVTPMERIAGTRETISNMQKVAQSYLTGMMMVIVVVATLNTLGLYLAGIPYALAFGTFAAILTIIPYIGIFTGALFPVLYTAAHTGSLAKPLLVIGIFTLVQFLEGNFITPNITGARVKLNPFAAIVSLVIGGEVWGISGMVVAIPILAMVKILLQSFPHLRPFAQVLSEVGGPNNHKRPFHLKQTLGTFFRGLCQKLRKN